MKNYYEGLEITQEKYKALLDRYHLLEQKELLEQILEEKKQKLKWEMFEDAAYFDMYAVRPVGDRGINSPRLFHLELKEEAERLVNYLNSLGIINE